MGYRQGQRYPVIVAIHGGPAGADVLSFNGRYGAQAYAGVGYVVLQPNYRGSTNYGEKHKTDIVGDYFRLGYDDIMTGVNHLVRSIVDSTKMGVLGWSAGGHWSNWILTHTTGSRRPPVDILPKRRHTRVECRPEMPKSVTPSCRARSTC